MNQAKSKPAIKSKKETRRAMANDANIADSALPSNQGLKNLAHGIPLENYAQNGSNQNYSKKRKLQNLNKSDAERVV